MLGPGSMSLANQPARPVSSRLEASSELSGRCVFLILEIVKLPWVNIPPTKLSLWNYKMLISLVFKLWYRFFPSRIAHVQALIRGITQMCFALFSVSWSSGIVTRVQRCSLALEVNLGCFGPMLPQRVILSPLVSVSSQSAISSCCYGSVRGTPSIPSHCCLLWWEGQLAEEIQKIRILKSVI